MRFLKNNLETSCRKTILRTVVLCALSLAASGQPLSKLFGAHANGSQSVFSSMNLLGGNYQQIALLNKSLNAVKGETTFDELHLRYFIKSASTIFIIDAQTGNVLDSITNTGSFHNIEYDRSSNCLIGLSLLGTSVVCTVYDLNTKVGTNKSTIAGADSIMIGESTFDPINRKYFAMTNLGIVVLDSNGILKDVLCASLSLFGMEYNPITNKIYYLFWNGSEFDFVSIEANTCSIAVLGSFTTVSSVLQGVSTFDRTLGHYYNKTNLGILQISTQTGLILQSYPVVNNFGEIEFTSLSAAGINEGRFEKIRNVFPNPSNNRFTFSNLESGSAFEVFDLAGRLVFETVLRDSSLVLDLEGEAPGIYFFRIKNSGEEIQRGKLILR